MRLSVGIVAACCAGIAGAAFVVSRVRFVHEDPAAPPDLAWLPPPPAPGGPRVRKVSPFGEGPCRFEANLGQSPAAVRFVCRGPAHATFLEDAAFTTLVPAARGASGVSAFAYRVRFDRAAERPPAAAEQRLPGVTNYFVGRDEASWVRGVPSFGRVRFAEVWPGIEVVWHGADGAMEYDFVVAPGADSRQIALAIEGAETCSIDAAGDLVLTGAGTEMRHRKPRIVQETASGLREVPGSFAMDGPSRVRIDVGAHDPSLPLTIDPVIGIRAGGASGDSVAAIAISKEDLVGMTGQTPSVTFLPSVGPLFATGQGMSDAFAVTFGIGTGSPVHGYTAIVGSTGDECFTDAQFAPDGSFFLVGFTTGAGGYPNVRPSQTTNLGGQDGTFVVIDRPGSNLVYSGRIGGSNHDIATSIALAPTVSPVTLSAIFVGVATQSSDVPLVGSPAFPQAPGGIDGLVLRFSPGGVQTAGTYVGGAGDDASDGFRLALAQDGGVACAFTTLSNLTPTAGAFQSAKGGGAVDGFVMRFPSTLTSVIASSYLTGPSADFTVGGIASRPGGGFVICGTQQAGTIPFTLNSRPQVKPGQSDAAVFYLDEALAAAPLVTYAGGAGIDDATGLICPTTSSAFLTGTAFQGRFAVGGGDSQHGSLPDQYVQQVNLEGGLPPFVTNVGSPLAEFGGSFAGHFFAVPVGRELAVSQTGLVCIAGTTSASAVQFPDLVGAVGGQSDVYAQSVTVTAVQEEGSVSEISLEVEEADVFDSPKLLRDAFHVSGSFDLGATQIDFSPGAEGSFALNLSRFEVTGPATIVDLEVALTDARWKATKGGNVMTWTSPKGAQPVAKIVVNQANDTFRVDLSKLDLPSVPLLPGRFDVTLGLPGVEGTDAEPLTAVGPGRLRFRPLKPSQVLTGDLVVSPGTVPLGTPFTTSATLWNRGTTPLTGQLSFFHLGFNFQSWGVTVPPRNALTLEPGTLDISTMVAVPSAGKGQLFRLFFNNALVDKAKGNVTKP